MEFKINMNYGNIIFLEAGEAAQVRSGDIISGNIEEPGVSAYCIFFDSINIL